MNTVSRARLPRLSAASINACGLHPYPTHAEIPAKASADEMRRIADSITTRIPIAWRRHVCLLIGSGVLATAQIGKAIISIPIIRDDMMLSPAFAGLIVAAFATLGAFFGLRAGIAVRRLDDRRSLILGMAVITIGGLIGAVAPNEGVLLAARVFEGAGFLGVVLAIPSILARIVPSTERKFVMAVWSTYMPAGIVLMMLLGPLLPTIGWRNLWVVSAAHRRVLPRIGHFGAASTQSPSRRADRPVLQRHHSHLLRSHLLDACLRFLRVYILDVLPRVCPAVAADLHERCARNGRYA
jgi:MFS family permease